MRPFKKLLNMIDDPNRDFQERNFILLIMIGEIVVFLVFIADIILGENIVEITALGLMLAVSPIIAVVFVNIHNVKIGGILVALGTTFIILPITFFFGGGLSGGSIIWFSFSYLYLEMLLTGAMRIVMIIALTVLAGVEYYIAYFYPFLIVSHTNDMFFLDSLVSVLLVGVVIYIMSWFQNRLLISENKRAEERKKEIEALNAAQNQFFSSMSHEIRTPINTIIGLNEMILRENVSDEVADDAANIKAASKMLLHLINDILDMSKFASGQMKLVPVTYKPGDMLSEIVGMLWIRAKEKNLDFHVNVAPDLPSEMIGDEVRIKQILINVLNNAIKYTKEGSVTLSIQCGQRKGTTQNVIYSVSDTGMGIKKENIPYLFTAFRRVDEEHNRHIEGTGLGLSIVKQFVDMMEGTVTVNSVYTKGTTFVIEIPQQVSDERKIGDVDFEKSHALNHRGVYKQKFEAPEANVLVVDDNSSNLLVVTKLLKSTKVKLDTASSGAEALKKTLNKHYHVIFMDHLMPEMDGLECHKLIRTQIGGQCRNSKVVALTANAGGESRALYAKEGFDGYLTKPISGDELEIELCRLLPNDIVHMFGSDKEILEETVSWMQAHQKKKNIMITTESVADLPQELIDKYGIAVIPHMVVTDEGVFRDGIEIETGGVLAYMRNPKHNVMTKAPSVKEHEEFFAKQLTKANNIIHISISSKVEKSGCPTAIEAASAFDNVSIVDTGHLSSGQGIMAIEACKLAEAGKSPAEILRELEKMKSHVRTSFVVNDLDFLSRAKQVSVSVANLTRSFMVRPVLVLKKGKMGVGRVFFGTKEHSWNRYIDTTLAMPSKIDPSILFITHVGLTNRDLEKIIARVRKRMDFDEIYCKKASPAIAVNCGAGTFGLLIKEKTE